MLLLVLGVTSGVAARNDTYFCQVKMSKPEGYLGVRVAGGIYPTTAIPKDPAQDKLRQSYALKRAAA